MAAQQNTTGIFNWYPHQSNDRPDYVYFIKNKQADLIKIGRSFKPTLRMSQIARDVLSLEATIKLAGVYNSISLERHLHQYFAETRGDGEWFIPSDDLLNLINDIKAGRLYV